MAVAAFVTIEVYSRNEPTVLERVSARWFVRPSVCPSVGLLVGPSVCQSVCLPVSPFVSPSVCQSVVNPCDPFVLAAI